MDNKAVSNIIYNHIGSKPGTKQEETSLGKAKAVEVE